MLILIYIISRTHNIKLPLDMKQNSYIYIYIYISHTSLLFSQYVEIYKKIFLLYY